MSDGMILLHIVFILACAGGSWVAGWSQGKRDIINMFIDDGITTAEKLTKFYSLDKK
jgi:hypothetical protein